MAKLIYIDTEAGSVDPKTAALLQLSVIVEVDGEVKDSVNWFLKPLPNKCITPKAMEIMQLTWADLDAPYRHDAFLVKKAFTALLEKYVSRYDKQDKFILTGWNSRFDEDIVRTYFDDTGDTYYGAFFWAPSLDVMSIVLQLNLESRKTFPNFQLGTVGQAYKLINAGGQPIAPDGVPYANGLTQLHDSRPDICLTRRVHRAALGKVTEPVNWRNGGEQQVEQAPYQAPPEQLPLQAVPTT